MRAGAAAAQPLRRCRLPAPQAGGAEPMDAEEEDDELAASLARARRVALAHQGKEQASRGAACGAGGGLGRGVSGPRWLAGGL